MQIIEKSIKELKPYEKNPRKNDKAVDYVANSIQEFGFKVPIVVDRDNVIVAGHTRYKAAKKLGLKEVPCIVADDLTEEQIKAYRLADNKVGEFAEWDFELLDGELGDILDLDMEQFGFSFNDEEESEAEEDDFDGELPEEPKSKLGDIYQLGRHRLMCGDATSIDDAERLMGGMKADMVFTDPPYNVDYSSKNAFLNEADEGNRIQTNIVNDNNQSDEQAKEELWTPAFTNMRLCSKEDCSIYVTMPQGGAHMMMMMSVQEAGWQVKHELVWVKNNHVLGRTDYFYKHEPILFGWAEKHNFYGKGKFDKSVWEIAKPQKSDLHPTMKPIKLIENCLLNSTKKGDSVLDLFGGSGSTLIACEQTGRNAFLCEISPQYVDVIIDRWEKFTGQKAVLLNGDN